MGTVVRAKSLSSLTHTGSTVAKHAGESVHGRVKATAAYKSAQYEKSLKQAFLGTDEDLRKSASIVRVLAHRAADPEFAADPSGCTAVACLIDDNRRIYCVRPIALSSLTGQANAGDSRAVISVGGEVKPLSYDHKPVNKTENSRIVAAGGFVEFGRVNGNLALSRALGDFEFKQNSHLPAEQQIVTADPDIIVHEPTQEDEFLIIACDGIWDVLTSQQAVDFVRRAIADRFDLATISEKLMDRCLAPDSDWGGVGCDNMTVLIVALLNGRTKAEWYEWIEKRVSQGIGYKTPQSIPNPFQKGGPAGRGGGMAGAGVGRGQSPLASVLAAAAGGGAGSLAGRLGVQPPGDDMDVDDDDDDAEDAAAFQAAARREGAAARGASSSSDDDITPTPTQDHTPAPETHQPTAAPAMEAKPSEPLRPSDAPHPYVAAAGEGLLDKSDK